MSLDSPYIYVSGIAESELLFNDTSTINIDLGLPDSFGQVWIQDINASFGFNATPHSIDLSVVAKEPIVISSSRIGQACALKIGAIRFFGYVTHVDSSVNSNGYITQITCQDGRKIDLNKYLLHTEPLLDSNLPNVIVVPKELNTGGTLYSLNSPLWLMTNFGATYTEIYYALLNKNIVKLPHPNVITKRLGNHEAYRWSFSLSPLFDAIMQIFDDCGYDLYYYNGEIRLIDRSKSINAVETFLDAKYKISTRRGYDYSDRATQYTILGAKKEGGVSTIGNVVQYENLVNLGATKMIPCWNDIEIMYHDNNGYLQHYKPSDNELKMALKGIEHWVYYKRYELTQADTSFPRGWMESRIDPYPFGLEDSILEAALSFGGGRTDVMKVIHNRRAIDGNWLVQWYDAVSKHARSYYGKLFYCKPTSDFLRKCLIIESAWVDDNVDNRSIPDAYSPFYTHGKIQAFAEFNKSDVIGFGLDGTSTPVAYTEWNESKDKIYLPIRASIHSPTSDQDKVFPGINDTRLYVTLPEIVVSGFEDHWLLTNLPTLESFNGPNPLTGSGVIEDTFQLYLTEKDVNDPKMTILPMLTIDKFFIPVQYNIRYGDDGSATSGNITGYYRGEIDDKFAPWTRQNPDSPIAEMLDKTNALIGNDDVDQFLEAEVTGLPEVNIFANFSNSDHVPVYPFTSVNITIGSNGLLSRYNSKAQLSEFLRANKIEWSRFKSRLDRIQHFSNLSKMQTDMFLTLEPQRMLTHIANIQEPQNNRKTMYGGVAPDEKPIEEEKDVEQKSFVKAVIITNKTQFHVLDPNGGASNVGQELYQGVDDDGNKWPPSWHKVDEQMSESVTNTDIYSTEEAREIYSDGRWISFTPTNFTGFEDLRANERKTGYAPCQDGYLRIGMPALYHQEDIEGTVFCYFTGGLPLEDARIAKLTSDVTIDGDYAYADITTFANPASSDQEGFTFYKVPFASPKEAALQGYARDSIVPIVHTKMTKGPSSTDSLDTGGGSSQNDQGALRPDSTHSKLDGSPLETLYIPNPPIIGAIAVTVIIPPNAAGSNGTVAVIGKTEIQFGGATEQQEDVRFIGADPAMIYEGDYGILTRGLNNEWYVTILKATFTPYSSFGVE